MSPPPPYPSILPETRALPSSTLLRTFPKLDRHGPTGRGATHGYGYEQAAGGLDYEPGHEGAINSHHTGLHKKQLVPKVHHKQTHMST